MGRENGNRDRQRRLHEASEAQTKTRSHVASWKTAAPKDSESSSLLLSSWLYKHETMSEPKSPKPKLPPYQKPGSLDALARTIIAASPSGCIPSFCRGPGPKLKPGTGMALSPEALLRFWGPSCRSASGRSGFGLQI